MSAIFKDKYYNFEECSIDNAKNLRVHVSEMIMRELMPDDFDD